MLPTRISVVVLARPAGGDLAGTLASIAAQSHESLEVLVVAGTAGPEADVALDIALPDERFRLIASGPVSRGAARNLGVAEATGEYLAFVDCGDALPESALTALHAALTASGSDFAAGNVAVRRERGGQLAPSWPHRDAFARPLTGVGVRRYPVLLRDRCVTNKLFRRSFWDAHGLVFPDVDRHADLAVTVPAYHLAAAVDVLPEVVLRRCHGVQPEPAAEPRDVADGYAAVDAVLARLAGRWRTKDRRRFLGSVLDGELRAFLDAMPDATAEQRDHIIGRAAAYVANIEPRVFAPLPAPTRLKWHLAGRGLSTELIKVIRFERGKPKLQIVRDRTRRYVVYPYWKDKRLAVPRRIYRARAEVELRSRVREVTWRDGRLVVHGEAYLNSVSMRHRWTSAKAVTLHNGGRARRFRARQRTKSGDGTGSWTWFTWTLDPGRLRRRGRWVDGTWNVSAAVVNTGVFRRGPLRGGKSDGWAHPSYHYVTDDVRIVPTAEHGIFQLKVETVRAKVTGLAWSGEELEITGLARHGIPAGGLRLVRGERSVSVPATVADREFRATVPLSLIGGGPADGHDDADDDPRAIDDTRIWTPFVSTPGPHPIPLIMDEPVTRSGTLAGTVEAIAESDPAGYLRLRVRTARLVVAALSWAEDGTLTVTGTHPCHERGEIVLRGRGRRQDLAYPLRGGTATVPATAVTTLAGVLPLRAGKWDVLFRPGPGERALAISLDRAAAESLPQSVEVAGRGYSVQRQDDRLVLAVTGDVSAKVRTAEPRLREQAYRKVARAGLRDQVLYSCFNGRQYSCNPRAIHEEMARQRINIPQLWVVNDGQIDLPDTVTPVPLYSADWHEAMAASRYIVTNHRIGDWFQRHPDQVVLQTWHGTPLKKIGRDVQEVHFAYAPGMKQALQGAADYPKLPEWSYLLSPNPFSTEIFRRAFAFKGEVIEAGYPRNDVLYSPDAASIAAAVRERIGIPAGKRVVLYAPTWRDDQFYSRGRYKFEMPIDLDRARAALGDDHVLLIRLHPNIVDGVPHAGDGFVYDVSPYPEIAELYLISDAMVTDYSSAMFDYANTRRPMLFFTYDLADYRDRLRGFYFDFETEAPGPLLQTSDALIDALRAADSAIAPYTDAYHGFVDRFCSLEDGKAAARVIDRLLRDR